MATLLNPTLMNKEVLDLDQLNSGIDRQSQLSASLFSLRQEATPSHATAGAAEKAHKRLLRAECVSLAHCDRPRPKTKREHLQWGKNTADPLGERGDDGKGCALAPVHRAT